MRTWNEAARDGVLSGTVGSILMTATAAWLGRRRTGSASAPTNATSQWVYGVDEAARQMQPSLRHTATGFAIHEAAGLMWGTVYEKMQGARPSTSGALAAAAATTAVALIADYVVSPRRFTPGFEAHLKARDIALTYVSFGVGLALVGLLRSRRRARREREQGQALQQSFSENDGLDRALSPLGIEQGTALARPGLSSERLSTDYQAAERSH